MERGALTPTNLRAAWWALRTASRTRRLLDSEGLEAAIGPPPPPNLPDAGIRGVRGALRRRRESCLVKSIVVQSWEAAHGRRRDLIIGVTTPSEFGAHAWLDGDTAVTPSTPYQEILRRELPAAWPS
jgi:Transglutaminase-like superfamily